jgi:cellulose 1,4-beta-cellobiosidase
MFARTLFALSLIALVCGQQVGTQQAESHPQLPSQVCTKSGCTTQSTSVVLDSNWRWVHTTSGYTNCYTGDEWDKSLCPDPQTCAKNCAIDGADYPGTYGIVASGNSLTLKFVTKGQYATNIGSRVYLLSNDTSYKLLSLKNKEFTFDVDVSQLPCGLNGALYFVAMDGDGGLSKYPTNKAGAKYGTGYCDAQCPHDMKFINGEANVNEWKPSPNDPNAGTGQYGTCCTEMDIWEANSQGSAYTPHPCSVNGQYRCSGTECGDDDNRYNGVCDKDGCDLNTWRTGTKTFYGPGLTVDSTKPFTVVTQFLTADNTTTGPLSEIRRVWVQNGKVIPTPFSGFSALSSFDSVSDKFCDAQKTLFDDKNSFKDKGGLKALGTALDRGLVLVMSLWDDHAAQMRWLDSDYPPNKPADAPGVSRGPCPTTSGVPKDIEGQHPDAQVKFSNIKVGDIGTTYAH